MAHEASDSRQMPVSSAGPARTHTAPGIVSPETVYGTIIVATIVYASSGGDSPLRVFVVTCVSVAVLWAAHVYSEALAAHGRRGRAAIGVRAAVRFGVRQSWGILYSAIVPVVLLLFGMVGLLGDDLSITLALWSTVVVLAVLGYIAFKAKERSMPIRLIGALGTAAFGAAIILLKVVTH